MLLSRSIALKLVATALAAVSFALLLEVRTLDSREAAADALKDDDTPPAPGVRHRFTATAYCKGTTTASGVNVRTGIAAADPKLLPVGSVVRMEKVPEKYAGVYTVMDTGPRVQGRQIDIYIWSCHEALDFGRRSIQLTVLRLGWNPQTSSPSLADRLFRKREAAREAGTSTAGPGGEAAPSPPK